MLFQSNVIGNIAALPERRRSSRSQKEFVTLPLIVQPKADQKLQVQAIFNGSMMNTIEEYAEVGRAMFVQGPTSLKPREANGIIYPNLSIRVDVPSLQGKGNSHGLFQMQFIGRLVEDPVTGRTNGGADYTRVRVAVRHRLGTQKCEEFITATAFQQRSKILAYAEIGQKIYLQGNAEIDVFHRRDRTADAAYSIMVGGIQLMEKSRRGQRDQGNRSNSGSASGRSQTPA